MQRLHNIAGHLASKTLASTASALGIPLTGELDGCLACDQVKSRRYQPSSKSTTYDVGSVTQLDLTGAMPVPAIGGIKYAAFFVDLATSFTTVIGLASKKLVPDAVRTYTNEILRPRKIDLNRVRTDTAGENLTIPVKKAIADAGGSHETNAPRTPESMGKVERIIAAIKIMVLAMAIFAGLHDTYGNLWFLAMRHAVWVYNNVAHFDPKDKKLKIPSLVFNNDPSRCFHVPIDTAFPFGCLVFNYANEHLLLVPKGRASLFVGYPTNCSPNTILVYDLETNTVRKTGFYKALPSKYLRDYKSFAAETPSEDLERLFTQVFITDVITSTGPDQVAPTDSAVPASAEVAQPASSSVSTTTSSSAVTSAATAATADASAPAPPSIAASAEAPAPAVVPAPAPEPRPSAPAPTTRRNWPSQPLSVNLRSARSGPINTNNIGMLTIIQVDNYYDDMPDLLPADSDTDGEDGWLPTGNAERGGLPTGTAERAVTTFRDEHVALLSASDIRTMNIDDDAELDEGVTLVTNLVDPNNLVLDSRVAVTDQNYIPGSVAEQMKFPDWAESAHREVDPSMIPQATTVAGMSCAANRT